MDFKIEDIISKVMNDKKFLESVFESGGNQFPKDIRTAIKYKLAIVLNYYLITNDTQTDYSFDTILKKFQRILENTDEVELRRIIESGYLTHSFNGSSKEYIQKYGFDYIHKLSEEEAEVLKAKSARLKYLSDRYGENYYIEEGKYLRWKRNIDKPIGEEFYYCTPGIDSIQYALEQSPERLYNGILKNNREPMIVGETKRNYLIRYLKKKIAPEYYSIMEQMIDDYCTFPPYIALLNYEKMKNVQTSVTVFDPNRSHSLNEIIEKLEPKQIADYFTIGIQKPSTEFLRKRGSYYLSDMVTLAEFIPEAEYPMIKMPDMYEIIQMYARKKGLQVGQFFDCKTGDFIRNPNLAEIKRLMQQMEDEQGSKWKIDERLQTDLKTLQKMADNYDFGDSTDAPEL